MLRVLHLVFNEGYTGDVDLAIGARIHPSPSRRWVWITGVDGARADLTPRDPDEFASRKEVARHNLTTFQQVSAGGRLVVS